jgi:hypothetical protein
LIVVVSTREELSTVPIAWIEAANWKANSEICSIFKEVLAGLADHGVATDGDNAYFPLYKPTFDLVARWLPLPIISNRITGGKIGYHVYVTCWLVFLRTYDNLTRSSHEEIHDPRRSMLTNKGFVQSP